MTSLKNCLPTPPNWLWALSWRRWLTKHRYLSSCCSALFPRRPDLPPLLPVAPAFHFVGVGGPAYLTLNFCKVLRLVVFCRLVLKLQEAAVWLRDDDIFILAFVPGLSPISARRCSPRSYKN